MVVQPEDDPDFSDNNVISEDVCLSGLTKTIPTEMASSKKPNLAITRNLVIYAIGTITLMLTTTITLTIITVNMELVVSKKIWGGRIPLLNFTEPLEHPTPYVIISHSAGKFCRIFEECSPIIRNIQGQHMVKYPDIGYNFVIGGDGNVYLGRGWDSQNFRSNNSIAVSFIGDFTYDTLTRNMISALKALLKQGVKLNKLDSDYKLVCDNQTQATLSPGENVFKEMMNFPNYYNETVLLS